MAVRAFLQILLFPLPWSLRRRMLSWLFGYDIAPSARIGFSLVFARECHLGEHARIGHLTMVKGLQTLRLEANGLLGNLNWVTGFPPGRGRHFVLETERWPGLFIGAHAAVTHRHIIDCTDRVTIGAYSTVGGHRSQILTHSIDMRTNRQSCRPTEVGEYCFVGTACVLLKGSRLPNRSVLGPSSVLTKQMSEEGMLYSGVPAVGLRPMETDKGYFVRSVGFVD